MNSLEAINLITADLQSKTNELQEKVLQLIRDNVSEQQQGKTKEFAKIPAEWFSDRNHLSMLRVRLAILGWDLVPQPKAEGYPDGFFRLCPFVHVNGVNVVFT